VSVVGGEPPKLDQSRFVGVQNQSEPDEAFPKLVQEPFGLVAMLESHDEIIGITHDNDIARSELRPPLLNPQVEDVVQVHVGQQW